MKKSIYSVFDSVSRVFLAPFLESNDASAARSFKMVCADKSTLIGQCPDDFTLFRVAYFNDTSGVFSDCEMPEKILDGRGVGGSVDES